MVRDGSSRTRTKRTTLSRVIVVFRQSVKRAGRSAGRARCVSSSICSRGACSWSAGLSGLFPDQSPKDSCSFQTPLSARKSWPPRPGLQDEANKPINSNEEQTGTTSSCRPANPPPSILLLVPWTPGMRRGRTHAKCC